MTGWGIRRGSNDAMATPRDLLPKGHVLDFNLVALATVNYSSASATRVRYGSATVLYLVLRISGTVYQEILENSSALVGPSLAKALLVWY